MRTFSDGKRVYSVDLMLAYIHNCKVDAKGYLKRLNLTCFDDQLKNGVLWRTDRGREYPAYDLLKHPEKYKNAPDMDRVKRASTKYPIIVWDTSKGGDTTQVDIVDGCHRIVKSLLQKKTSINAYVFDTALMKKFVIYEGTYDKFRKSGTNTEMYYFMDLFKRRFGRHSTPFH